VTNIIVKSEEKKQSCFFVAIPEEAMILNEKNERYFTSKQGRFV